jgi:predicted ATP-binding protein involved in virulence
MFIRSVSLNNFRCFEKALLTFQYPGRAQTDSGMPTAACDNVNLLLGNNGTGKTTILKGIAMALISPVLQSSGFYPYSLVRRVFKKGKGRHPEKASVFANVLVSSYDVGRKWQPEYPEKLFCTLERQGDQDRIKKTTPLGHTWRSMLDNNSSAFLVLAYGATRRMAPAREAVFSRSQKVNLRFQRVHGLFDEEVTLIPLSQWLPNHSDRGRCRQVINLLNQLLTGFYKFEGHFENGEYHFERNGSLVPLGALSDGYRAYIAWLSDLLYHVCSRGVSQTKLQDIEGIVMVDEIDLHLHPEWQRTIIKSLSVTFPRIQFIFTSHSPLLTGSLQWSNIWVMQESGPEQLPDEPINGLSADQVLLSPYFGIPAVRAESKMSRLRELDRRAQGGDRGAAYQYIREFSVANEVTEKEYPIEKAIKMREPKFNPPPDLIVPPILKRRFKKQPVKTKKSK